MSDAPRHKSLEEACEAICAELGVPVEYAAELAAFLSLTSHIKAVRPADPPGQPCEASANGDTAGVSPGQSDSRVGSNGRIAP